MIADVAAGLCCGLTDFKPRLLGRAAVVHLAHERAHLHRVLVLMVQAVRLEEAEESGEGAESDQRGDIRTRGSVIRYCILLPGHKQIHTNPKRPITTATASALTDISHKSHPGDSTFACSSEFRQHGAFYVTD